VRDAAISAALPLTWKRITPVLPEGQPNVPLSHRPFIDIEAISPQCFRPCVFRCAAAATSPQPMTPSQPKSSS
jgi:hypothetical protein